MGNSQVEKLDKFVKELSTLHWALMAGILLAGAVITFQFTSFGVYFNIEEDYLILLVALLGVAGVLFGKKLYEQKILELHNVSDFDDKLQGYRAASILKFSLVEGPALMAIVLAMFNENLLYIFIAVILLNYFYTLRISREKVVGELGLNL